MIELRTPAELDGLRVAGRFVADVLDELLTTVDVGVNLLDLDRVAARMIADRGAVSCYVDYHPSFGKSPFGKHLCTSVNDAALHGLPHDRILRDGDVVSMDFAASVDGWVADSAVTVQVGTADPEDQRLIDTVERALVAGIAEARPGNKLGDVSHAIGAVAHAGGYGVNLQFGGHGVGHTMHGDPHVPNDGRPGRGLKLRPGLVVAIEPWLMRGTDELYQDDDGWTLKSVDGSRAAHVEHTVAVTEQGPEILTLRRAQRDQ
ncbi:type I methionyl aminopeptidase [Curtobacterium sp. 9128]|uniref:type I methionyl aminopeptidase n=1 Tax=Curtobacterium sp. 9128 TaxID=1793722 RepID=UPI0011A7C709|nr:type I methionyl aminopeptidase [Curtobacterium sp. 9128]